LFEVRERRLKADPRFDMALLALLTSRILVL